MITVYTASFGERGVLYEPKWIRDDVQYVCFTDKPESKIPPQWKIYRTTLIQPTPNLTAKQFKILPHEHLEQCEGSIWIDSNFEVTPLGFDPVIGDSDLTLFKHFERDCIYDEAIAVVQSKFEQPDVVERVVSRYRAENFPEHFGLSECGIIIRRDTPEVRALMRMWWNEICLGSHRDQLSFMYCVWKSGFPVNILPETTRSNPYVNWHYHNNYVK